MDAAKNKILFLVNSLVIRDSLEVPPSFTSNHEELVEEDLIQQFWLIAIEDKQIVLSKCFKIDVFPANQPFPLDISLFNEESQLVISMLSQFLDLDAHRFIL